MMDKNHSPFLSIIVPVYSVEKYLNECVDSILGQDFTDFELILVDDGSPDNCGRICDDYAEKDDRVIVIHKENGGLSSARNAGIDICKGEYVWFIDSDDYIDSNVLGSLIDQVTSRKSEILMFGFDVYQEETGNIIHRSFKFPGGIFDGLTILRDHDIKQSAWSCMTSARLWRKHNLRFKNKLFMEDLEIYPRLLQFVTTGEYYKGDTNPYVYRIRKNSITQETNLEKKELQFNSYVKIKDSWVETFYIGSPEETAVGKVIKDRYLNYLYAYMISFIFKSRLPKDTKLKYYRLIRDNGYLLDEKGRQGRKDEPLIERIFWKTAGRSYPLLVSLSYLYDKYRSIFHV